MDVQRFKKIKGDISPKGQSRLTDIAKSICERYLSDPESPFFLSMSDFNVKESIEEAIKEGNVTESIFADLEGEIALSLMSSFGKWKSEFRS